ncbi:MAG: serine/threonine-protein kinase, partial [Planctomycetota bacterium]
LKTVRARLEDNLSTRERFRRERDIALRLAHPNVLRTHEAELTEDGHMYMICEYCPGGSVYQQLQRMGHIPVDLGLFWMIGTVRGLSYLWEEHGIIHRDLKPDNLLVGEQRQIKISDFGLARPPGMRLRVTAVGTIFGSPEYMSPEQMRDDKDMDIRSDLYSLGATFRELLSEPPAKSWALESESDELLPSGLPAAYPLRPDVPQSLAGVLKGLTAHCREDRPPTPAALLKNLESIAADLGVDPNTDPEKTRDSRATVKLDGKGLE